MEDGVVEIFIGLGLDDMTIAEAADKYAVLENREYKMPEAFMLAKLYFEKLQRLI